ncbi:hypothetical protein ONS95_005213 [Cadophora gregata]|uniref:uncharacterized protein n=1 Tax=Cadophora gregata TaxID=51156 RepID=UPI0026DB38B4|nr:uncharacterized protein ONS95_005213 [Cadophora gregata]KAK0104952.1 hypothetical protein ONS95_005213 [Cadophora gregata]KAK0114967.1 hypothetical protein ONS96_013441 [Cadophora gregata f. sp. sojae]
MRQGFKDYLYVRNTSPLIFGLHRGSPDKDSARKFRKDCLIKVGKLYVGQGRKSDFQKAVAILLGDAMGHYGLEKAFHRLGKFSVLNSQDCRLFGMVDSQLEFSQSFWVGHRDILGWTPRHYNAARYFEHFSQTKKEQKEIDYKLVDLANRTPFHYIKSPNCSADFRILTTWEEDLPEVKFDRDGIPWIHWALVRYGDRAVLSNSYPKHTVINFDLVDNFGRDCLHFAIHMKQKPLALYLLSHNNCRMGAKAKYGMTVLMYACLSAIDDRSMLEVVHSLLDKGVSVDESDVWHRTALAYAASVMPDGTFDSLRGLVQQTQNEGEEVNRPAHVRMKPPFINALKVAKILVKHGAKVESNLEFQKSPLKMARDRGNGKSQQMIELLEKALEKEKLILAETREREEQGKITHWYKPRVVDPSEDRSHDSSSSGDHEEYSLSGLCTEELPV